MKSYKTKNNQSGFLSLNAIFVTVIASVAALSVGVTAYTASTNTENSAISESSKSGAFCVTATSEDSNYFSQVGNCDPKNNEETLSPENENTTDHEAIMVTTWNTKLALNCKEITLPISGVDKGALVDWGSGNEYSDFKDTSPVYNATQNEVVITVKGSFNNWGSPNWSDSNCLISVDRWGDTGTKNLSSAFHKANNLVYVHAIPISAKNLNKAFSQVESDFKIGNIDTSNITSVSQMFNNAKLFNQDLSHWDFSKTSGENNFNNGAVSWTLPKPKFK